MDIDILMISYDNVCGAVGNLCDAINTYTGYKARYATAARNYIQCDMDLDLLSSSHRPVVQSAIRCCSAIHWTDITYDGRAGFCDTYNLTSAPYINKKINCFHYHGSILRQNYPLTKESTVFLSTPDLLYYATNGMYLPNLVNRNIMNVKTANPRKKEIIQCLTVTNEIGEYMELIKDLGVYPKFPPKSDIKSSTIFTKAMKNIEKKIDVEWEFVKNLTNTETIIRKARTSMMFDQMWLGSYGVNAIEALYLRKPVIARLSDYSRKWYEAWAGDECPILQAELKTFEDDLIRHITSDDDIGSYCRKWVRKAHDAKTVARIFVEKVMEGER